MKTAVLDAVRAILFKLPERKWQQCDCEVVLGWNRDTVYWNKKLVGYVREAANELGYSNMDINSGAGHDAQYVSYMLPTTMIFVPSDKGLSHCELEHTSVEQCTNGAAVLLNAVLKLDKKGL